MVFAGSLSGPYDVIAAECIDFLVIFLRFVFFVSRLTFLPPPEDIVILCVC